MVQKYSPPDIKTAEGVYQAACFGIDAIYYCNAAMIVSHDPGYAVEVVKEGFLYPKENAHCCSFIYGVELSLRAVIKLAEGQTKEIAKSGQEVGEGEWKRVYQGLSDRVLYWRFKVAREAIYRFEESTEPGMITPFQMSVGLEKALILSGIRSLSEIQYMTFKDLLKIKGIGPERAGELEIILDRHKTIMQAADN